MIMKNIIHRSGIGILCVVVVLSILSACNTKTDVMEKHEDNQEEVNGMQNTSETKRGFHLISVTTNADFNYSKIASINEYAPGLSKLNNEFKPVKGHYTIVLYGAHDIGLYHDGENKDSYYIIMLKIDDDLNVIDGYYYPLQWSEMPLTSRLYRISIKNLSAAQSVTIKELHFKCVNDQVTENEMYLNLNDTLHFPIQKDYI